MPAESEKQLVVSGSWHNSSHTLQLASRAREPPPQFAVQHVPFLTQHLQPGAQFTMLLSMMLQPGDREWA
jgi:hypothetical protein